MVWSLWVIVVRPGRRLGGRCCVFVTLYLGSLSSRRSRVSFERRGSNAQQPMVVPSVRFSERTANEKSMWANPAGPFPANVRLLPCSGTDLTSTECFRNIERTFFVSWVQSHYETTGLWGLAQLCSHKITPTTLKEATLSQRVMDPDTLSVWSLC